MTDRSSVFSLLWMPSRRQISLAFEEDAAAAEQLLRDSLESSGEVTGRTVGRGIKIERHPSRASLRGAFAPSFYGILREDGEDCRLVGHFQLHPVGRLYIAAWIGLSTVLALGLLVAGGMRATAESTPRDALPFLLPVLLPFLGLGLAYWLRRRGRTDEAAMRRWLQELIKD